MIFSLLILGSLIGAAVLLAILMVIDLRHFLLPNKYVFPFGALALIAHGAAGFSILPPEQMAAGAAVGGGMLWIVRALGTAYYKQEAMGLGDVKLLAAAGLWLGPEGTLIAILLGAVAGLIHGLIFAAVTSLRTGARFNIRRLVIPAGPGFIVGIVGSFVGSFGESFASILLQNGG